MVVYIKNEVIDPKATKKLNKALHDSYNADFKCGLYSVEIEKLSEFTEFVRDVIRVMGKTSVYPFVTPFDNGIMLNLREMDFSNRCFK